MPDGEDCIVDQRIKVCSAPACQRALAAERQEREAERRRNRPRRQSSADVHKEICRRRHGKRAAGQKRLRGLKPTGGNAA